MVGEISRLTCRSVAGVSTSVCRSGGEVPTSGRCSIGVSTLTPGCSIEGLSPTAWPSVGGFVRLADARTSSLAAISGLAWLAELRAALATALAEADYI